MELEPVYEGTKTDGVAAKVVLPKGAVHISSEKQQMIGVRISRVEKSSTGRSLRLLGRVVPDEARLYKVKAAVDGWIQDVYPVTAGTLVKKGDPLASFYSPDFYAVEQNFLFALTNQDKKVFADTTRQVQTLEDNLRGFGMDPEQLEEIKKTRVGTRNVVISAPGSGLVVLRDVSAGLRFQKGDELYRIVGLDKVWIYADLYENEARYFRAGGTARVTQPQMGAQFDARISDVLPQFDPTTRTFKVRLQADNPEYILRPDMFVDVDFPLDLPPSLAVPAGAVLDTGTQKTVFVDLGNGYFEPRRVETGWRMDNQIEIVKGLMEGEKIVVSGNFLIDSESRLQGLASGYQSDDVVDPVCGMTVDPTKAKALASVFEGQNYYFCSQLCKEAFDKDPRRYLRGGGTGDAPAAPMAMTSAKKPEHHAVGHPAAKSEADEMSAAQAPRHQPKEAEAVDPVCGMTVDPMKAGMLKTLFEGETYYFCNPACKETFENDPHSYMPGGESEEVSAFKQVDPVCGMTIDLMTTPVLMTVYKGKTYYFCKSSCKDAFEKDPARYLSDEKRGMTTMEQEGGNKATLDHEQGRQHD